MIDFKNITPRIDPRGQQIVLKHNVVMLEPYHAKQLHKLECLHALANQHIFQ